MDEIGEMDLNLQAKLLRVIQEKRIRRVGSESVIDINVRIIAATNRDLMEDVKEGLFRKDLYYRLNVLPLNLIPLRERTSDIPILFSTLQEEMGSIYEIENETWDILLAHSWDGNVRELRNIVEYLNNLEEYLILPEHLPNIFKTGEPALTQSFCINETTNDEAILILLYKAHIQNRKMGRKTLANKLAEKSIFLSEQEVRYTVQVLLHKGFVTSSRGRGGTRITELGINYINRNQLV